MTNTLLCMTSALALMTGAAAAENDFNRTTSFPVVANPRSGGTIAPDGEATTVSALGNTVIAGVNTSRSSTEPSGHLVHPDESFVTVAIENARDEDADDGPVPQMPSGWVAIIPLDSDGMMQCDQQIRADVTGLADIAPEDAGKHPHRGAVLRRHRRQPFLRRGSRRRGD